MIHMLTFQILLSNMDYLHGEMLAFGCEKASFIIQFSSTMRKTQFRHFASYKDHAKHGTI